MKYSSFHWLATRVFGMLLTVLGISLTVFALLYVIPGDPVEALVGEQATPADRDALRHALALDLPVRAQLGRYYRHLLSFDFGNSLATQQPIAEILPARWWATLQLAAAAMALAVVLAVPLGMLAARYEHRAWDRFSAGYAMFGSALPNFVIGPVLIIIFAVWLGWVPIAGADTRGSIVLPAVTLSIGLSAVLARQLRAALLVVLTEDYLRAAAARGLSPAAVLLRHALPNAALTLLTLIGMQFGGLLGGTVITETIFGWPGLGALTVEAISRRDYPMVQACVLCISATYVLLNALTDLLYAWCDPRVARA